MLALIYGGLKSLIYSRLLQNLQVQHTFGHTLRHLFFISNELKHQAIQLQRSQEQMLTGSEVSSRSQVQCTFNCKLSAAL